jgi:competence protein ComEC
LLFILVVTFLTARKIVGRDRVSVIPLLATACIALALGMLRLDYAESRLSPLTAHEGSEVMLTGKILREPEVRETNVHLYVRPTGVDEYVLVTTDKFSGEDFRYGDTVTAEGVLKRPEAFETDGGRAFDYPGYLRARGVEFVLPFAEVSVLAGDESSFIASLYKGKRVFMDAVERAVPEPESGLGEGVLLGVKRALGEDLERTFRETGIIHIVVLSGYNVMIVVSTFMYLLTFFFFPRTRMFIGILAILTFALLVGPSATVVRASIMAGLLLVAQTTGRTYAVLRALLLAGVVMLALNPHLLVHDPGFQLSFLATLGLILFSLHIEKRLTKIPETVGMRGFVTATIATQIMVLPLLLYHTGLFSTVSILVNVLVLPMVPIAMLLTFLTGMLGMVSHTLGILVGFLAHASLAYIIKVAEFFGAFPLASFSVPAFPFGFTVLMYTGLGVWIVWLTSQNLPAISTINRTNSGEVENDYEGWVIEEEKETPRETQSVSRGGRNIFPFR